MLSSLLGKEMAMIKVMVVDDEIYFATNIAALLRANNPELDVIAVYNPVEALKQLEQSSYDIVITDVRMPKMSGIDFIKTIKRQWPTTSVIIMTAYGSQQTRESAFQTGTLFYIEKPFRIEKLEALLAIAGKPREKKAKQKAPAKAASKNI